ncbi:iron-containing alcohol dehydrogenase [Lactiplantibacillus paraplantarum]|uniref:iron-containing alcohol dehydrogenase n=1 Tax=Lactiplantibacillus paraplantarum TaxID=60520 RepID=UPI000512F98C|nr:iron-containing alcohol dehydrogenase [Lactiplantibacillus paraplantarum]OAX74645.1 1,3-propanediol dehydrogenase [Lactiplantibacillus plantarum]ALO05093.1 1,3-propanediol dehydrogenase [Lactiplantibacillus paraplantarum]KGE75966.1 1,3-propanediol dehydrogenase [Lactiplantibacillus paraplantarum]MCW1911304.1 iron-containing alcohol dehydrogenase [Lactiplantibacillus paraplantarum]RDG09792.1 iron-containing alcohol dehydrogenase [Lactiplantibacillus paraplantarum]
MTERNFDFLMPSVNFFGPGVISKIGARAKTLGMQKPVIVTDKFLESLPNGAVAQVRRSLDAAGIDYVIYNQVEPNPKIHNIQAVKALYQANQADSLITIGGGSAHDTGKGAGIIMTNGDDITKLAGIETLKNALPPLIAVNTTAGTGSELTRHCVITNEETHYKFVVASWRNMPLVSFNDPTLMLDVPKGLTAATGMDAFVQAIEPFVSVDHNPITDSQCIQAIKLIETSLREAVANGHNLEARTYMVEAEMLAGMAFNNANLGYVHAMAHQLGGQYDAPHGVCCALLLPYVEEYNLIACPERFAELAKIMGENTDGLSTRDAAELAIKAMKQLSEDVGIPHSIKEIGAKIEDFEHMATNALKDGNAFSNPRKGTKEDIIKIFQAAYDAK